MAEFDYSLDKPGKANIIAKALSHKNVVATLLSTKSCNVLDTIKEGMQNDIVSKKLVALVFQVKTQKFWKEEELPYTTGRLVYLPRLIGLRHLLIKKGHDTA